jgi:hypothetical protein
MTDYHVHNHHQKIEFQIANTLYWGGRRQPSWVSAQTCQELNIEAELKLVINHCFKMIERGENLRIICCRTKTGSCSTTKQKLVSFQSMGAPQKYVLDLQL